MRSLVALLSLSLSGCLLFFDDGGRGTCAVGGEEDEPAIAQAPLRNPETLTCDSFGGGCNPDCGPCPELADLAPIPTWGTCGSVCEALDETSCAADPGCRVVKDLGCAVQGNCVTDFIGCFPTDQLTDRLSCTTAQTGEECSRNADCTAFHSGLFGLRESPQAAIRFFVCMPEGQSPGRCFEQAECDAIPPACPPDRIPGVANGCWTGACIPTELCEAVPPQPF